ncbi:hypothetical protein [Oryzibacter oryziterrae]|uniref:hypothetical protein n=1 Tax=Oryzibacter oryziterrae TaxID=2766474 RepID=UPI0028BD8949|nr:hypothetical protein [Oryzibacter oryziterrae]
MVWLVIETLILTAIAVALGIGLGVAAKLVLARPSATQPAVAGQSLAEFLNEPPSAAPSAPADITPPSTSVEPVPAADAAPESVEQAIQAAESQARDSVTDPVKAAAADQVGLRPMALSGPREGRADDLKKIKGIGPQNEARLNALGIFHFSQIAAWTEAEAKWIGTYLAFPGRIEREHWIEQARDLAG